MTNTQKTIQNKTSKKKKTISKGNKKANTPTEVRIEQPKQETLQPTHKTIKSKIIPFLISFLISFALLVILYVGIYFITTKIAPNLENKLLFNHELKRIYYHTNDIYGEPETCFEDFYLIISFLKIIIALCVFFPIFFIPKKMKWHTKKTTFFSFLAFLLILQLFQNVIKYEVYDPCVGGWKKPIIYLYPKEPTDITVRLGKPERLTHTYPQYQGEWQVTAQPNGMLKDKKTGRQLYALYWEGKGSSSYANETGFVVAGQDTIPFLEEKLALLGLNEREAEEFIIYWLPQMENNPYNQIYFATASEQAQNMPLEITPKPETLIRVFMVWKPLQEKINIPEQTLITPIRTGYTVLEWGGSKITE